MAATAAWTPALASAALIVVKSTLLLGTAAAGARALRRSSAAARHLLWSLALAALLALPALVFFLPGWRPAFLAVLRSAPSLPATGDAGGAAAALASLSIGTLLLAVWAAGAAIILGRLMLGLRAAHRLARNAETVDDPEWTDLLERLGRAMGVRGAVALLRSPDAAMPLTWGALHPAILIPAEADGWPAERRRVVLMHELAHVARRDCLLQTLAMACCALYWFHPGAWWAARRMRLEREEACDDAVLAAGARASDYAGHLLDVARAYRAPALAAAIAMARPSHLEGRVRAVLQAERDRRAVDRRTGAVCAATLLLATLPLAAAVPSPRPAPAPRPVAWELPPARSSTQARSNGAEYHVAMRIDPPDAPTAARQVESARTVTYAVTAAASRTATSATPAFRTSTATTPRMPPATAFRTSAATASHTSTARASRSSTATAFRASTSTASRAAEATAHAERRHRSRATLVATVDDRGRVHAELHGVRTASDLSSGIRVRVQAHGATSVGIDLRIDPRLSAMVHTYTAAASKRAARCVKGARTEMISYRGSVLSKKFSTVVRRAAAEHNDVALRVLDDLNAGIAAEPRGAHDDDAELVTGGA